MQMPQIRLQSQKAQIELQTTPATQTIEQPQADMYIEQPHPELVIQTTPGRLNIDQTQAWHEMDIKSVLKRVEEFANKGYQDWLEGIARVASEGDEMMQIENGQDAIVAQATRILEGEIYDTNITWIPSPFSVKINYQPANLNLQWNTHKPNINVQTHKPSTSYQPGEVNARLKQKPELHIDFTL